MAENYTVNYNINVKSQKAIDALNAFQTATSKLTTAQTALTNFQKKLQQTIAQFSKMTKKAPVLDFKVASANKKLDGIIRKLERINKLAAKNRNITFNGSGSSSGKSGGSGKTKSGRKTGVTTAARSTGNLGYKAFGPTPLTNNGGLAVDMLKGMGIAYGISGIGQAISDIVEQSVSYDNTMKTVENILKSHDTKGDFAERFSSMSKTVRNVGMETKFKVTEVADAAKFLAMAGLDLESIQQSIRPIADIALVGDTDLGETADLVTNIMTAYNIKPSKMRQAADIMTNTFTMSNTTLTEIAESYKYAASLLSAGGVEFEEATAAIGVLGDAGIKGSQAGTTLRTIMANIANPTAKQKKAWSQIGVSTKDKNGNTKPLLEIFQELNGKNLAIADYYRLFHKTAAAGAVSLADHVDKWNNIYLENFLSGGLSAQLANEKKNTLQGLWAQVTSVFTDTGVTAFQGIEGGLRHWMKQAISWLQTDEAKEKFRDVANAVMQITQTIIDATKWFAKFFDFFSPLIQLWVKFQLTIWPVVKAITAFKSVWGGLQWLRGIALNIANIRNNMLGLASATSQATGAAAGFGGFKAFAGRAIGVGAGALGAYAGMSQITKDDANIADYVSGGLFGAAGMGAMIASGPVGWAAAGILAAGGGIAAVIGDMQRATEVAVGLDEFISTHQLLNSALTNSSSHTEQVLEFVWRRNYDINELLERRIELSKQLYGIETPDVTTQKDVGTEVYKDFYERFEKLDHWYNTTTGAREASDLLYQYGKDYGISIVGGSNDWSLRLPNGRLIPYNNPEGYTDANNAVMYDVAAAMEMLHGQYRSKIIDENQKRIAQMLYGKSTPEDIKELQDTFNKRYNPAKMTGLIYPDQWNTSMSDAANWTGEDVGRSYLGAALVWASLDQVRKGQQAIYDFKEKLRDKDYDEWDVVNALRWGDYNILGNVLANYSPSHIADWYASMGYANGTWHGINGDTPDTMAQMAASNMQKLLDSIKQLGLASDPATEGLRTYANTLLTLAQSFLGQNEAISGSKNGETKVINGQTWRWNAMTKVWELVDDNEQLSNVAQGILDFSNSIQTLQGTLNNGVQWGSYPVGDYSFTPINYTSGYTEGNGTDADTRLFSWLDGGTGASSTPFAAPWSSSSYSYFGGGSVQSKNKGLLTMTPQQMGNAVNSGSSASGKNALTGADADKKRNTGPKTSDYKNHYNKGNNAAPKQVIVRIGNLMNVESVDLSNPDNAAVIANLKGELAQALVDVVHDFDETWHG